MAKAFKPVVLTANALEGGEAVWWTGAGWSPRFADAKPAATPEQAKMLETLGAAPIFESVVVGAYLAEVVLEGDSLRPATRREAIRAAAEPTFDYLLGARDGARAA
jgi:hypothetical protein